MLPPAAAAAPGAEDPTAQALAALRAEVLPCTRCKLHRERNQVVFGEGSPNAEVLFIGEAPGAVEDQTGRPFVGPAGQLLDRILVGAMGLQRSDVYIANINKCRPPGNRAPEADEVAACLPYLRRQVDLLRPRAIVCLGRTAAQNLLGTTEPMRNLRGRDLAYAGIPVVVTWHPAYLLRDPSHKRETWEDIKRVNRLLGRPEVPGATPG
ncbi:MAG: uracil-DNA glycosylase [Planctomycetes bacterium]|nr:uracil-DNA glycosylase [Planctomycetota bacterium]